MSYESIAMVAKRVKARLELLRAGDVTHAYIPTQFRSLNQLIGGGWPMGISVLAGRPMSGKTALWEQEVVWQASQGIGCVVYSIEMLPDEHLLRMALRLSKVGLRIDQLSSSSTSPELIRRVEIALDTLLHLPIKFIKDEPDRTIPSVLAQFDDTLRTWPSDWPAARIAVIDYLQLLEPDADGKRYFREELILGSITKHLHHWAMARRQALILISLLAQSIEREKRSPRLGDLQNGAQLEQDARVVLCTHRPSTYKGAIPPDTTAEACHLVVAKAREGQPSAVEVWWHGRTLSFDDHPPAPPPPLEPPSQSVETPTGTNGN